MRRKTTSKNVAGADCTAAGSEADVRCLCGSLLARLVPGGVELRCRRCKRAVVVRLHDESPGSHILPPGGDAG